MTTIPSNSRGSNYSLNQRLRPPPIHQISQNSEEVVEIIGRDKLSSNDCTILLGFLEKESLNSESDDMFSSFKQFGLVDNENKRIEALDKAIAQCNNVRNLPRFKEGILLKCLDKNPTFPYLNYSIFKGDSYAERTMTINNYIHSVSNYSKSQYGPYEEVFTINKMGSIGSFNLPTNRHAHAGFIINSFKIIDSNRTESLEGSWLIWSGASVIYKSSPRNWNLRKISLVRCAGRSGFKKDNFDYVLLCEFGNIFHPNNTIKALDMCERLKTRNCGHISLYQIKYAFESEQIQGMGSMTNYNSPIHARPSPTSLQTSKRNPLLRGVSQDVGSTTLSRSPRHYAHKLTSMGSVDQSSSRYDPFYESETMDF
uniref:SET domain-containing protein n=1 Tax=Rhabditophanes sp. KR3021 TaxID=114890 RepID=A0AC35UIA1_9BILA